ncbi:hypothetical protein HDU98_002274 [Podochytrium sp. JEL0797]|nr:hypothetical protein HDU98_002274 [Podochytrium sp. JEL0797]
MTFDTTSAIKNLKIQSITLKLECQSYHVTPPITTNQTASESIADEKHHRRTFLDFFHSHGKAPKQKTTSAHGAVNEVEHLPVEIKSELSFPLLPATEVNTELKPGRHAYAFEIDLPSDWPVTTALDNNASEVLMLVSRFHGTIEVENVKEECYAFLHVVETL